jgi:hypothetical protein
MRQRSATKLYLPGRNMASPKLHLVFGGRVTDPQTLDFCELDKLDIVGIFPDFAEAEEAWRSSAQRTVDDAEMKYVVVHLHKLLEPDA